MDFKLAAIAGAGVDMANRHRLTEHLDDFSMQFLLPGAQCEIGLWGRFGNKTGLEDFLQDQMGGHVIDPLRYSSS